MELFLTLFLGAMFGCCMGVLVTSLCVVSSRKDD